MKHMANYEIKDEVAVFHEGVTMIKTKTFKDCTWLKGVIIPASVTEIGHRAFYGCTSLESIVIPKGVKKICSFAFMQCTSLTAVTLPVGVNDIDHTAFYYCSALSKIYVPAKKVDYYKKRLPVDTPEKLHDKIVELAPEKRTKVRK